MLLFYFRYHHFSAILWARQKPPNPAKTRRPNTHILLTITHMSHLLTPLTLTTAPEASRPALEQVQKAYGFVPNLLATFSNSPALLKGYLALDEQFNHGTFTPRERQIILLTTSVANACGYCEAAHSTILKHMLKVPVEIVDAIRDGITLKGDAKLNALVEFVRSVVETRGHAPYAKLQAFLDAGYSQAQVAEVLIGVALKTMSNYLDHLSPVPIEPAFAGEAR